MMDSSIRARLYSLVQQLIKLEGDVAGACRELGDLLPVSVNDAWGFGIVTNDSSDSSELRRGELAAGEYRLIRDRESILIRHHVEEYILELRGGRLYKLTAKRWRFNFVVMRFEYISYIRKCIYRT